MQKLTGYWLGWCLALAAWMPAVAQPTAAQPVLRAAVFDIPPYGVGHASGTVQGLYAERLHQLADQAGMVLRLRLLPFARVPLELENGGIDLTLGFATPTLRQAGRELAQAGQEDLVVVGRAGLALGATDDWTRRTVGRARGGCSEFKERMGAQPRWFDVTHFESGVRMLAAGRLDALCLTQSVLAHYLALTGTARSELGEELVVGRRVVWWWMRKDLPLATQTRLLQALQALDAKPHAR